MSYMRVGDINRPSVVVIVSLHTTNLTAFVNLSVIVSRAFFLSVDIGKPVMKSSVIVWNGAGVVGIGCNNPGFFDVDGFDILTVVVSIDVIVDCLPHLWKVESRFC